MAEALISLIVISLIVWVFFIIVNWMIYQKAEKPGWASIIPIYNIIVMLEIVGKPWWWFLLMCIPGVGLIFAIIVLHQLSLSFGKGSGFTLGLIFLGFIFFPILAFGDAKYVGPGGRQMETMMN